MSARSHAYENPRPEVQRLVPESARRILDLGCSSGALGAALKERQGAEVVGVELDPAYARRAGERLDRAIEADVAELLARPDVEAALGGRFDCVIAADVLEHLVDPWGALRQAAALLEPGGMAVVSLPNVRYWNTFFQLGVRGTWPRHDEGIFDRTHLRWFTASDAIELMHQAGLRDVEVERVYRLKPSDWRTERQGRWFARTPLRPFFVFQHVLRGVSG